MWHAHMAQYLFCLRNRITHVPTAVIRRAAATLVPAGDLEFKRANDSNPIVWLPQDKGAGCG